MKQRLFVQDACQIEAQVLITSVCTLAMFNKDLNAVLFSYLTCYHFAFFVQNLACVDMISYE